MVHLIQHHTSRPDVDFGVVHALAEELGRLCNGVKCDVQILSLSVTEFRTQRKPAFNPFLIMHSARLCLGHGARLLQLDRNAKITEFQLSPISNHEQVLRFYITVDNTLGVAVLKLMN